MSAGVGQGDEGWGLDGLRANWGASWSWASTQQRAQVRSRTPPSAASAARPVLQTAAQLPGSFEENCLKQLPFPNSGRSRPPRRPAALPANVPRAAADRPTPTRSATELVKGGGADAYPRRRGRVRGGSGARCAWWGEVSFRVWEQTRREQSEGEPVGWGFREPRRGRGGEVTGAAAQGLAAARLSPSRRIRGPQTRGADWLASARPHCESQMRRMREGGGSGGQLSARKSFQHCLRSLRQDYSGQVPTTDPGRRTGWELGPRARARRTWNYPLAERRHGRKGGPVGVWGATG